MEDDCLVSLRRGRRSYVSLQRGTRPRHLCIGQTRHATTTTAETTLASPVAPTDGLTPRATRHRDRWRDASLSGSRPHPHAWRRLPPASAARQWSPQWRHAAVMPTKTTSTRNRRRGTPPSSGMVSAALLPPMARRSTLRHRPLKRPLPATNGAVLLLLVGRPAVVSAVEAYTHARRLLPPASAAWPGTPRWSHGPDRHGSRRLAMLPCTAAPPSDDGARPWAGSASLSLSARWHISLPPRW